MTIRNMNDPQESTGDINEGYEAPPVPSADNNLDVNKTYQELDDSKDKHRYQGLKPNRP